MDLDLTGPIGGQIALAFGSGCGIGYGFCSQVITAQFRKLWEERSEMLIAAKVKAEEEYGKAHEHFRDCEKELVELKVRVAQLEVQRSADE